MSRTKSRTHPSRAVALALALCAGPSVARAQAPDEGRASEARAAEADRGEPPALSRERIRRALRRYRREPSVARVVRAALRERTARPSRIHDAMNRARGAGWLPRVRASLRRGQAVDLRGLADDPEAVTNVSTDDDLTFEASLTFDLDRIVFASQETTLLRELRATEQREAEVARAVVHLYFERRRLQLERDLLGRHDLPRALRILETEALLDAFTGGAFTRMMGARANRESPSP
ncbi:MAG TPA: hypothetical protein RMH99_23965 [Sandaracinaceae bacterium LLY-WYZ-13_1]|nr:hypothetical protein [Sandaracinaceae bacterium LLY-WYZ-13_1]